MIFFTTGLGKLLDNYQRLRPNSFCRNKAINPMYQWAHFAINRVKYSLGEQPRIMKKVVSY